MARRRQPSRDENAGLPEARALPLDRTVVAEVGVLRASFDAVRADPELVAARTLARATSPAGVEAVRGVSARTARLTVELHAQQHPADVPLPVETGVRRPTDPAPF